MDANDLLLFSLTIQGLHVKLLLSQSWRSLDLKEGAFLCEGV